MHVTFDDVIFVMSQKLYMKIKIIKKSQNVICLVDTGILHNKWNTVFRF